MFRPEQNMIERIGIDEIMRYLAVCIETLGGQIDIPTVLTTNPWEPKHFEIASHPLEDGTGVRLTVRRIDLEPIQGSATEIIH